MNEDRIRQILRSVGQGIGHNFLVDTSETQKQGMFSLSFADFLYLLKSLIPEVHDYFVVYQNWFHQCCQELENHPEIRTVIYGDELYPMSFYDMEDPPLTFSYVGCASWLGRRTVSIVGSRDPHVISLEWIETEFYEFVKKSLACVVSGGARGVDQAAHRISLRLGLPTIAILPSGLLNIYPRQLLAWQDSIVEYGGCLLSEFELSEPMKKYHFDYRNRLIAAMSPMTVVAESRRQSGTMLTARHAVRFGRTVLVVPGHPQWKNFGGSLDLLSEGASIVRDAQDLELFFESELRLVN